MDNKEKNTSGFGLGFTLGAIAAAILLVVLGTKEGRKTARIIIKKIDDYLKGIQENLDLNPDEIMNKAHVLEDETRTKVIEIKDAVIDKVAQIKESASHILKEEKEKLEKLQRINNVQTKGREIAEKIGKKFFSKQGKKNLD